MSTPNTDNTTYNTTTSLTTTTANSTTDNYNHNDNDIRDVGIRQRLYNLWYGNNKYYIPSGNVGLDHSHIKQFIGAYQDSGRTVTDTEHEYLNNCMKHYNGINSVLLFGGGMLGIPLSHILYPGRKVAGFGIPAFTSMLTIGVVGTFRLYQCQVAMIEHSNTPIALDYRHRLFTQFPNHPLKYRLEQQSQSQLQLARTISDNKQIDITQK